MKPNSILSDDLSEQRWVDQISQNFDDEVDNDISNVPVCVFSVPKSTSHFNPEAYVPQAIALGPYHHFQTHLYQMERYKVAAVKALLNPDQVLSFKTLVINSLKEKEPMVRACYHKYMDLDNDTLAWIIAIDGLFLLGLLKHYGEIAPMMPKKLMNDGVLYRDIMLLENQIPFVILNEIQKSLHISSSDNDDYGDRELVSMLRGFCEVHSPLKLACDFDYSVDTDYLHLLDLMYHLIVNNQSTTPSPHKVELPKDQKEVAKEDNFSTNLGEESENGLSLGKGKKDDNPMKILKNIPWEKISNLLGHKIIKEEEENDDNQPHVMEIEIPSVSSLSKYGRINFCHMTGGIKDIKFDESKATLYLPVITLDAYSEVVLRNLICYELATTTSTPELAQYVDLMSGIVDTEADAKLLRAKGIIRGTMNDKEIADLFNGMNKYNGFISIDNTIEQLNEYYNNRPMIKAWRFAKKHLSQSQQVVTVVLTIFLSLLMILYSFCEVYGCSRLFHGP